MPEAKAQYRVRADGTALDRLDLLIDFLPVVHVANTMQALDWGFQLSVCVGGCLRSVVYHLNGGPMGRLSKPSEVVTSAGVV